jgi:hypothetical protein
VYVHGVRLCVLDEGVSLSLVEEVEGYSVMLVGMVVGMHILIVSLDDSFEFP